MQISLSSRVIRTAIGVCGCTCVLAHARQAGAAQCVPPHSVFMPGGAATPTTAEPHGEPAQPPAVLGLLCDIKLLTPESYYAIDPASVFLEHAQGTIALVATKIKDVAVPREYGCYPGEGVMREVPYVLFSLKPKAPLPANTELRILLKVGGATNGVEVGRFTTTQNQDTQGCTTAPVPPTLPNCSPGHHNCLRKDTGTAPPAEAGVSPRQDSSILSSPQPPAGTPAPDPTTGGCELVRGSSSSSAVGWIVLALAFVVIRRRRMVLD